MHLSNLGNNFSIAFWVFTRIMPTLAPLTYTKSTTPLSACPLGKRHGLDSGHSHGRDAQEHGGGLDGKSCYPFMHCHQYDYYSNFYWQKFRKLKAVAHSTSINEASSPQIISNTCEEFDLQMQLDILGSHSSNLAFTFAPSTTLLASSSASCIIDFGASMITCK